MINPNISKFVTVLVADDLETAQYKGRKLRLSLRGDRVVTPGKRRLYLKYSITFDDFYLSDRA